MTNIWEFLLFTVTCSVSAAFILIIKRILEDKLSARWQYGIWAVLVLRCILPIFTGRSVLIPMAQIIELLKSICERGLSSAFSSAFEPLSTVWPIPSFTGTPISVTDWIFIIYIIGTAVYFVWHMAAYVRLKIMLHRGENISGEMQKRIDGIAEAYGLKACNAFTVNGIDSAFVCGIIRPVMAIPNGGEIDDAVILHELLHLKYYDSLQSVVWCALRALHWCNPFMHYAFDRVLNDMESLCDRRVLELLEGEDRRKYGEALLKMANEKYARAVGTTSVSNGGKNISRRIEAIARFKRYPKGMALVSVCIMVFTASIILSGSKYSVSLQDMLPVKESELRYSMAVVRINRCETVAGALDTYAKGLILKNGVYLAAASPMDMQEELYNEMVKSHDDGWVAYHIDTGEELQNVDTSDGYMIYNIAQTGDKCYTAKIALDVYGDYDEESGLNENNTVLIPVAVSYENGWVVKENGRREVVEELHSTLLSPVNVFSAKREYGSINVGVITEYQIYGSSNGRLDETPNFNAEFDYVMLWNCHEYDMNTKTTADSPGNYAGFEVISLENVDDKYTFSDINAGSGMSSGYDGIYTEWVDDDWDGTVSGGGGIGWGAVGTEPVKLPKAYAVRIVWDGEVKDEFLLTEADG